MRHGSHKLGCNIKFAVHRQHQQAPSIYAATLQRQKQKRYDSWAWLESSASLPQDCLLYLHVLFWTCFASMARCKLCVCLGLAPVARRVIRHLMLHFYLLVGWRSGSYIIEGWDSKSLTLSEVYRRLSLVTRQWQPTPFSQSIMTVQVSDQVCHHVSLTMVVLHLGKTRSVQPASKEQSRQST